MDNMSDAYKCDRCYTLIEGEPAIQFSDFLSEEIDLCKKCLEEFKKFMKVYDKPKRH